MKNVNEFNLMRQYYDANGDAVETVIATFREDYLDDILRQMGDFLRGCGFVVSPYKQLTFVDERTEYVAEKDTNTDAT